MRLNRCSEELRSLSETDWRHLIFSLTVYAQHRIWRCNWRTSEGSLPGGKEAKDIALEAIGDALTAKRVRSDENVDLLVFLKGVVKSKISHLLESADHTRRASWPSYDDSVDPLADVASPVAGPDEQTEEGELLAHIRRCIRGDSELEEILDHLASGRKPGEIAEMLGLERQVVYVRIRRLRRHLVRAGLPQTADW